MWTDVRSDKEMLEKSSGLNSSPVYTSWQRSAKLGYIFDIANVLPKCCERIANVLPTRCKRVAHPLSMENEKLFCVNNVANVLPTRYQCIAKALTTRCQHVANALPTCYTYTVHEISIVKCNYNDYASCVRDVFYHILL